MLGEEGGRSRAKLPIRLPGPRTRPVGLAAGCAMVSDMGRRKEVEDVAAVKGLPDAVMRKMEARGGCKISEEQKRQK
jgi:hypothetical protein